MPFSGLEKVTFMDPATNDRIQINSIDAGLTSFEHGITEDDETTGAAFGGYVYPLVIGARNLTQQMIDLFEEWAELQTPIHVYGYGPDMFLLWEIGKPIQFRPVDSTNASSGKRKHVVSISHNGHTDKIKWGANLVHLVAPFVPPFDGYDELVGIILPSIAYDGYFYTVIVGLSQTPGSSRLRLRIVFPITGANITYRVEAKDIANPSNSDRIGYVIVLRDEQDNQLTGFVGEYVEGGVSSNQFITSSNNFYLDIFLFRSDPFVDESLGIGHPQLRAGTNSRYTEE